MRVAGKQQTLRMQKAARTNATAPVRRETRPPRRPDEIKSARAQARSHAWFVIIFVLLRLAEVGDWLYFQTAQAAVQFFGGDVQQNGGAWLAAKALLTTAMLAGLWYRQRWVEGLLKAWLGVELIVSATALASTVYLTSVFPSALLLGMGLRLVALLILSCAKDIRLFLSVSFMPIYTWVPRQKSHA
jgi:hypothetical protein